ncbi:hypothetical protein [Micromonospora sp. NPDC005979]|uniref:hypothetical protein n=1 Tax=Micromonospora sp. NPDC005979 TaxID=3156726 RepID=UPI00339F4DFA
MPEDLPVPRQGDSPDAPAVIEWGADEPARARRFGNPLVGLTRDPRLPLLLAGLGAVAGIASMIGEWLLTTVPSGGPEGPNTIEVPASVSEIGGFGVAYLAGLLGLACAVALALGGTAAVRANARLVGLTLAGALLALLVAAAATLHDTGERALLYSPEEEFRVEYGRGLVLAFVACVLFAAALRLAGAVPTRASAGPADDDARAADVPAMRSWRRRPHPGPLDDGLPPPADLTVEPATPFARPENPT